MPRQAERAAEGAHGKKHGLHRGSPSRGAWPDRAPVTAAAVSGGLALEPGHGRPDLRDPKP